MLQTRDVVPANTLRRAHDRGLGLGSGEDPLLVHHRDEDGQSSAAHVRADGDALVQNNRGRRTYPSGRELFMNSHWVELMNKYGCSVTICNDLDKFWQRNVNAHM